METQHIITDNVGLLHLSFSILALIFGTMVLFIKKGTKRHKRLGYNYSISMVVVLVTSFMMYNLYDSWGIFHWMAIVSTTTLVLGLVPMVLKRPKSSYVSLHFGFMYWSVIGLYGAFVAEVFVRFPKAVIDNGIPNGAFYGMLGTAIALTMGLGAFFFVKNSKRWEEEFSSR